MDEYTIGTLTRAATLAEWVKAGSWDHVRVVTIPGRIIAPDAVDVDSMFAASGPTFVAVKPALSDHSRETVTFIRMETDEQAVAAVNEAADGLASNISLMILALDLMGDGITAI